jgi:hypothetical protein
MPAVIDHYLRRQLSHDHQGQFNLLYLLKAGDTATGTIILPITAAQANALINSINAGTLTINAQRVQSWHRHFMTMGG